MTSDPLAHCLTLSELQAAESGALGAERLRHLAICPLCAAAYEGLSLADEDSREEIFALGPESQEGQPYLEEANVVPLSRRPADKGAPVKPAPGRSFWLWPGLAMAASILIGVLLLSDLHRDGQRAILTAGLGDDFDAVVEPFARRERGEGEDERVDAYRAAATAYEEGDYAAAAQAYQTQLSLRSDPLHDTRGYYELGVTHWRLGRLDSAADYLTRARMGEADYFEDASWALARVYLLERDSAAARVVLRDLAGLRQGPYVDKARELLERL